MGDSVKIVDLARKNDTACRHAGRQGYQNCLHRIKTGRKNYLKNYLQTTRTTLPTHHSQILIGKVREYEYWQVKDIIDGLIESFNTQNNELIVQRMKDLVPEYKSNNSIFQKLDS